MHIHCFPTALLQNYFQMFILVWPGHTNYLIGMALAMPLPLPVQPHTIGYMVVMASKVLYTTLGIPRQYNLQVFQYVSQLHVHFLVMFLCIYHVYSDD